MAHTINILLVDDEKRNLDALEAILDDPSYRLLRAEDADKCLRVLLENDVAAIVLDIKMPGVSGLELAQLIKGTRRFRQIPILFLTAYLVEDQDIVTGYGAGAVDYLTKPVNPQILRHKVAVFADLFRKTRDLAELNAHLETRVQARTAELEKSEAALREASNQKDRFLATLAHELRNPLAPLRSGLAILLAEARQTETAAHTLTVMNRQLDHVVRLVDDLLDVSRISRGTLEMRKENVELSAIIDGAIQTARPFLEPRKQTIQVTGRAPVYAFVDPTRIAQVVGNLLNNASKHSETGALVNVEFEQKDGNALIRVIDQGCGIPVDHLDQVFEMFTKIQSSPLVTNDGLGIGLALSRQLAELHGGNLRVESAGEGTGATFTLSVPIGETTSPAVTRHVVPIVKMSTASLRIVVVEDNEDAADMMALLLTRLGHQVSLAHNGNDGVDLILREKPQVVFCDLGLPGIDGVEVCLRVMSEMSSPPVMIALTGWGMREDRNRTEKAGFKYHLVKPVAADVLQDVLKSVATSLVL